MKYCVALLCIMAAAQCFAGAPSTDNSALLLITVADNSQHSPQRGYHRAGYQLSPAAASAVSAIERDYALKKIDGWPIRVLNVYCAVMAVAKDIDTNSLLQKLLNDGRVNLAQSLQTFDVHAADVHAAYNDPYFPLQYGHYATQIEQWHRRATGRGVQIAIVDTGVDRTHPDLQKRIRIARNFVDDSTDFDGDIHGTAVAGIIAATANNAIGIVGLAPDADLLVLKACWPLTAGEIAARCNSFTLAKALSFAIEQGADVINLSLGGPQDSLLTQLLQLALQRGILIVAAQDRRAEFPANMAGVIAVKASADNEFMTRALVQGNALIEANASELLSTSPGGRYDFFSGSSMAAARVSGLSALMRQRQQRLSAAQLLEGIDRWLAQAPAVAQLQQND